MLLIDARPITRRRSARALRNHLWNVKSRVTAVYKYAPELETNLPPRAAGPRGRWAVTCQREAPASDGAAPAPHRRRPAPSPPVTAPAPGTSDPRDVPRRALRDNNSFN